MAAARFLPIVGTSRSRSGARAITSSVAVPNVSTIRSASRSPTPEINPEPR
jgi:hypothetical protein